MRPRHLCSTVLTPQPAGRGDAAEGTLPLLRACFSFTHHAAVLALMAGLSCLRLSLQTLHYFTPVPLLEVLYTGICERGPLPGTSNVAQATFWVLPE